MMGTQTAPDRLFYDSCLDDHVPADHLEAAQRADAMLDKRDVEGQRAWLRILAAVKELQNTNPQESDVLH